MMFMTTLPGMALITAWESLNLDLATIIGLMQYVRIFFFSIWLPENFKIDFAFAFLNV